MYNRLGGVFKKYKLLLTNLTSAFWHGLYPGYYLSFGALAVFTTVSHDMYAYVEKRIIKKYSENSIQYTAYKVILCITTKIASGYYYIPFFLLEFTASWAFYKNTYFCIIALGVGTLIALRVIFKEEGKKTIKTDENKQNEIKQEAPVEEKKETENNTQDKPKEE